MKLNLDLSPHFWIGLAIFIATGVSSGGLHLTHMVPEAWIPTVTAWLNFLSFIGSGYLTAALGMHNADPQVRRDLVAAQPGTMVVTTSPNTAPAAVANKLAAMPEVRGVISTPEVAASTPSDKVVATASDLPTG